MRLVGKDPAREREERQPRQDDHRDDVSIRKREGATNNYPSVAFGEQSPQSHARAASFPPSFSLILLRVFRIPAQKERESCCGYYIALSTDAACSLAHESETYTRIKSILTDSPLAPFSPFGPWNWYVKRHLFGKRLVGRRLRARVVPEKRFRERGLERCRVTTCIDQRALSLSLSSVDKRRPLSIRGTEHTGAAFQVDHFAFSEHTRDVDKPGIDGAKKRPAEASLEEFGVIIERNFSERIVAPVLTRHSQHVCARSNTRQMRCEGRASLKQHLYVVRNASSRRV